MTIVASNQYHCAIPDFSLADSSPNSEILCVGVYPSGEYLTTILGAAAVASL